MDRSIDSRVLTNSLRAGHSDALTGLFTLYHDRFWRTLGVRLDRELLTAEAAADVLAAAHGVALAEVDDYLRQPWQSAFVWLRLLVGEAILQHRRKLSSHCPLPAVEVTRYGRTYQLVPSLPLVASLTTRDESGVGNLRLYTAIDSLPVDQKDLIVLRHLEELTNTEVAELLGMTVAVSSRRYVNALRRLQQELGER